MKKIVAILLCCLLILAGCSKAPVPNIGTEETTVGTDPVHEGPLDFGELEAAPSPTTGNSGSNTGGGGSAAAPSGDPSSDPTVPASSGTAPTETTEAATQPTTSTTENTNPTTEPTETTTEPAPLTTDPEGFYDQVVRP